MGVAYIGIEGSVVSNAKGGVVGVPVSWVIVVQGFAAVAAVIQGVATRAAIRVASSTAIGTTSSWVN
jgi:hypothetical protein